MSGISLFTEKLRSWVAGSSRVHKRIVFLVFDFFALIAAVWAAYSLRLGSWFVPSEKQLLLMIAAPIVAMPIFIRLGIYRAVIRFLPDRAIWTIIYAVALASIAWVFIVFLTEMSGGEGVPRSIPIIYFFIATLVVGASRFMAKALVVGPTKPVRASNVVAIYGAGNAGIQLCSALIDQRSSYVAGFLDDNKNLWGTEVAGVRVYDPKLVTNLVKDFGVNEIIISIPSISATKRREIVESLSNLGIRIRTLPLLSDLVEGKYLINQLREIDIDELLGRSSVPARPELLQTAISGQTILVTGAGGSIGSELVSICSKWQPKRVVLFEANEFALYKIQQKMLSKGGIEIVSVLASVLDEDALKQAIEANDVDIVFHAAAHKHVPLLEENVIEGVTNNVFGTLNVAKIVSQSSVKRLVLISSDKAVNPTNVMGATKRWAELIIRFYSMKAEETKSGQIFAAVRFGNVLGSNGSVVPTFREQIEKGGPVTLTDERMTRYFMSIHEAAELIAQASAMAGGGDVFVLEMGEPVKIIDLARNMINLAGLTIRDEQTPNGDIEIVVTGIRPGEKLFEELFYNEDTVTVTDHPKIMRAKRSGRTNRDVASGLKELELLLKKRDEQAIKQKLFSFIEL
jgi:FlaA1/EpsC-like NDP-sugar epimerase